MTEKLLTGMLSLNTNKQVRSKYQRYIQTMCLNLSYVLISQKTSADLKGPKQNKNYTCIVRFLGLPQDTTLAAVIANINESREKTGHRGFRPGLTQTGLYSHRRWLEA